MGVSFIMCFFAAFFAVRPSVADLAMTNPSAVNDRRVGAVIVADSGSVSAIAEVTSDPCPEVQWMFGDTNITGDREDYTFDNPCVPGSSSPHTFTLTIANLTTATSGAYSAVFSNFAGTTILPKLFVTVPGRYKTLCVYAFVHACLPELLVSCWVWEGFTARYFPLKTSTPQHCVFNPCP